MRGKIPALYVYNTEDHTLIQYHGLNRDEINFSMHFDGVAKHVYACAPEKKIRIEIASHEGDIFHDRVKHEYRIWFFKPRYQDALSKLKDHILGRRTTELCYHEAALDKLRDEIDAITTSFDGYSDEDYTLEPM